MATITATEFNTLMDLSTSDLPLATGETIIDLAVDLLNNFSGADIPNMSGTAASKTWSGTSKEKGAIHLAARAIYYGFFRGVSNLSISGISLSVADVLGNATVMETIKQVAGNLREMDVSLG